MKRKTTLRAIASFLALMLMLAAIPFVSVAEGVHPLFRTAINPIDRTANTMANDYPVKTPEGYNENDYQKMRAFLETADEYGIKNGDKLDYGYDPDDPGTWGSITWTDEGRIMVVYFVSLFGGTLDLRGRLDLSDCTELVHVYCEFNQITEVNVVNCGKLRLLECAKNQLTELVVSSNPLLEELSCGENALTELDVRNNLMLLKLRCADNLLTEIDVRSNTRLTELNVGRNRLTELDVSNNIALRDLDCESNMLFALDVRNNTRLFNFYCTDNLLTELDVSNCPDLSNLYCGDNLLTELDISNNTGLWELACDGNKLTELDISNQQNIGANSVTADGAGFIGHKHEWGTYGSGPLDIYLAYYVTAIPAAGSNFLGWYDPDGNLLSTDAKFDYYNCPAADFIARFESDTVIPEGYSMHDYLKLRAFLEITDPNGVKNGDKVSNDYDPDDPSTWGGIIWTDSDDGLRIYRVSWRGLDLCGQLDLSDCTEIWSLDCAYNQLTGLVVSCCTALEMIECSFNQLAELNTGDNTELLYLYCDNNQLTELDVSSNTGLNELWCAGNQLTELDLSNNPVLLINRITAEGDGFIGYRQGYAYMMTILYDVIAVPAEGNTFLGWYDTDGNLLSTDLNFNIRNCPVADFVAKFTPGDDEPMPDGDIDGDGSTTVADAILAARYALSLMELSDEQIAHGDVDGSGTITVADAILIARISLGLIQP